MSDFDVEAFHELLTAIADGGTWEEACEIRPFLTVYQFDQLESFVKSCLNIWPNAWKTWSDEDVQLVRRLYFGEHKSIPEIARRLGRSENAIEFLLRPPKKRSA
ncbi:MAG: hypothetical protein EPO22_01850 [Dehalococcoidia bacterium]|nr:MAG: hypothetical protein EPO22_01850 [Dehalococcoidia bacterium]